MSKAVYEYSNQALPFMRKKKRGTAFSDMLSRKNRNFLSACCNTGLHAIFDSFSLSSFCFPEEKKRQTDDMRQGPTVFWFFLQVTDEIVDVMSVLTSPFAEDSSSFVGDATGWGHLPFTFAKVS